METVREEENKKNFCDLKVLELSQNHWADKSTKGYMNFLGYSRQTSEKYMDFHLFFS